MAAEGLPAVQECLLRTEWAARFEASSGGFRERRQWMHAYANRP
jgi:hypothetical protein